jgi:hypothetical protein
LKKEINMTMKPIIDMHPVTREKYYLFFLKYIPFSTPPADIDFRKRLPLAANELSSAFMTPSTLGSASTPSSS